MKQPMPLRSVVASAPTLSLPLTSPTRLVSHRTAGTATSATPRARTRPRRTCLRRISLPQTARLERSASQRLPLQTARSRASPLLPPQVPTSLRPLEQFQLSLPHRARLRLSTSLVLRVRTCLFPHPQSRVQQRLVMPLPRRCRPISQLLLQPRFPDKVYVSQMERSVTSPRRVSTRFRASPHAEASRLRPRSSSEALSRHPQVSLVP